MTKRTYASAAAFKQALEKKVKAAKEQTSSDGFVESGFQKWLEDQRDRREKYLDFYEFLPPDEADLPG